MDILNAIVSDGLMNGYSLMPLYQKFFNPFNYGVPVMVGCACTFKPLVDKGIRLYEARVRHVRYEDGTQEVETIGRARWIRDRLPRPWDWITSREETTSSMGQLTEAKSATSRTYVSSSNASRV